jgi:uncharacterized protein
MRASIATLVALLLALCASAQPASAEPVSSEPVVARARLEVERKVTYDPAYVTLTYPKGDPPPDKGVCTDVVVRSYRAVGIDFQQRIHEDILKNPAAYPTVTKADRNIDHRRVSPMLAYLRAHARPLPKTFKEPAA